MDPQKVEDQDDMTWQDYQSNSSINWANPAAPADGQADAHRGAGGRFYDDQPFVMTLPRKHSDLFGNPQIDPVRRANVAKFYADFWNKPQEGQPGPHAARVLDGAIAGADGGRGNAIRPVSHAAENVPIRPGRPTARRDARGILRRPAREG